MQNFEAFLPFTIAADDLAAIPYYPAGEGARMAIAAELRSFVRNPQELNWLVKVAIGSMRKWLGVVELRGIYCTQFRPLDGKEAVCSTPGFRAEDFEFEQSQLTFSHQKYLPAPDDTPILDEERKQIEAVEKRMKELFIPNTWERSL